MTGADSLSVIKQEIGQAYGQVNEVVEQTASSRHASSESTLVLSLWQNIAFNARSFHPLSAATV